MESLGVSVVGVYDYKTGQYDAVEERDIARLEERLASRPLLVGFNIKKFDLPVLRPYLHFDPTTLASCDIMEEIQNVVGHRIGLDSVAQATLGHGKTGNGLDAIKYYRNGEIDKLKKYCLDDVRITKEVYEYACKNKELFFSSKFGTSKTRVALNIEFPPDTDPAKEQMNLF
jgi:DEAD/DEAH box helicase domain-containing protein